VFEFSNLAIKIGFLLYPQDLISVQNLLFFFSSYILHFKKLMNLMFKNDTISMHTCIILALGGLRQKDLEFKAILSLHNETLLPSPKKILQNQPLTHSPSVTTPALKLLISSVPR
jgi:hypothetical protein